MSMIEENAMTAETMQSGDFEARVTEIVNRILARHKPRFHRADPERELILEGFAQSDKRFEQADRRFEEMIRHTGKRFEELRQDMNARLEQVDKRFEQVDRRFEQMREDMNRRFDESRQDMIARFEQVDKRFERVDKRFEEMFRHTDKRFEDMHYALDRQVSSLRWTLGIITTLILAVVTAYRFVA